MRPERPTEGRAWWREAVKLSRSPQNRRRRDRGSPSGVADAFRGCWRVLTLSEKDGKSAKSAIRSPSGATREDFSPISLMIKPVALRVQTDRPRHRGRGHRGKFPAARLTSGFVKTPSAPNFTIRVQGGFPRRRFLSGVSTDIDSIPGGSARGESNLFCKLICGSSIPGHRSVPERGEIFRTAPLPGSSPDPDDGALSG